MNSNWTSRTTSIPKSYRIMPDTIMKLLNDAVFVINSTNDDEDPD